jgi:hypothetical protein
MGAVNVGDGSVAISWPQSFIFCGAEEGRGWTRSDPRCSGRGAAQWCDEYPFQSTLQAGPGASLELVPAWEQRIQAGKLSSFYSACGLSAGDDFLVTPSFAVPVTTWTC